MILTVKWELSEHAKPILFTQHSACFFAQVAFRLALREKQKNASNIFLFWKVFFNWEKNSEKQSTLKEPLCPLPHLLSIKSSS